jgi:hypothetical protein
MMTPAAKQLVDQLRHATGWRTYKPGYSRYYKKADKELIEFCSGPTADLSLIAEWADAWREHHRDTGPFHFVDIPISSDGSDQAIDEACNGNCILTKLQQTIQVLQDPNADKTQRIEALLWVVHLVGDVHQPLHCSDNGDKGGNKVNVVVGRKRQKLHAAWDTGLLYVEHAKPAELAADLLENECKTVPTETAVGPLTPRAWAQEAFGVAKDFVYPQVQRDRGNFTKAEVAQAWPVVRLQLARAGMRLAAILNRAPNR